MLPESEGRWRTLQMEKLTLVFLQPWCGEEASELMPVLVFKATPSTI
jgi:hypothetical protein